MILNCDTRYYAQCMDQLQTIMKVEVYFLPVRCIRTQQSQRVLVLTINGVNIFFSKTTNTIYSEPDETVDPPY